jgi:hypothetical protein
MKNIPHNENRREFIKQSSGIALGLSLSSLVPGSGLVPEALAGEAAPGYVGWEDIYRRMWTWDKVTWGSHTNASAGRPAACSFTSIPVMASSGAKNRRRA